MRGYSHLPCISSCANCTDIGIQIYSDKRKKKMSVRNKIMYTLKLSKKNEIMYMVKLGDLHNQVHNMTQC